MFKLNNDANPCGTSLRGHFKTSYSALVAAFGEPVESDGYKCSGEWLFEDKEGNVFTLYDWKETNLYDECNPSVSEFRNQTSATFHIGGGYKTNVAGFEAWLNEALL